ncbi:anti-sigma factor family protein [Brevibacillus sp. NPDC003359]|uniref:anti-sigma factor family protein n=1 Tax=unclassified Brevibacillus TaxID=2684853 RepID=UPI00369CA0B1
MTNEEVFELMQRDLDGDLLESEQQTLHRLIQKDAELQLKYNRLKDVSQQLEHLPPVVPPFSIVDSILPKLESAAAKPAAVKSTVNEEILPTLEVKRESSSLPETKKWKRMKVWMASLGSTAVAASLLVGMLFSGGDGKKHEVDSFQNGTDMTPAVAEQPKSVEPVDPTPSSNNPIPSNSKEEEDKSKKTSGAATQTKSKKPPAKTVKKQTPPPKKTNPTPPPKKAVPPTPVITDDQPSGWPIGLDENPDREDKEPANDDKDDGRDKQAEKDKGKNKEKKKNKDND